MTPEEQWDLALTHAGFTADQAVLVLSEHRVASPSEAKVAYFPPDAPPIPSPFPLSNDERSDVAAAAGKHRVAVPRMLEARVRLGGIRWGLERARQFDLGAGVAFFTEAVNSSLDARYGGVGMGSAVVWHSIPSVRDADSAAGHFVTDTLGPQYGDLWTENGALFRADQPTPDLASLPARLVVFAAIHAEDLESWAAGRGIAVSDLLREVDPQAGGWWASLLEDADFTHLRRSAPYYVPSAGQITDAGANPAEAWRPLQRHFDITMARGRAVIGI